ncbi:MAG: hypothetical protein A3F13_07065 [Gammaproteobacteria bacterium RIFCSPHIGHO2_12_FULL_40_19]|nr:MAG: hypothetical protein A3F13_07065 [Gammaproteobacteria bacterium RIFCSPHIGHO2_12_FULL_40_19]
MQKNHDVEVISMSYRAPKAQNSSLMALIRDHTSEQKKSDVETSALELDFESITELSIHGYSHLIDARISQIKTKIFSRHSAMAKVELRRCCFLVFFRVKLQ